MMEPDIASLRKAAPEWSLAGDKNLLQVLENIHQKLITKCQEVNTTLDEMVNKLDNASVDLQNVNNKFLALSNSQFIESRVYDEDVTSDVEQEKKADAPVSEENELSKLKQSLAVFERMHEAVRILDSDSSDEEDDFSTILKPKDLYADRPLPYIIGSQQWRTKWHVGLAPSESDSESSEELSKRPEPREQYSESESEDDRPYQPEATRVSSSSEIDSEPSPGPSGVVKPADIAAQIAKRLAAQQPPPESVSRESSVPESGPRKVYRAEQPIPVFSEEPPPLDNSIDDYSDHFSDEDDIFAELHRKPSVQRSEAVDPFVDQLFGEIKRDDHRQEEKMSNVAAPTTSKNDSKPDLLPQQEVPESSNTARKEQGVKKPVGGMSLFGSSQGAESIGAAILKRNQRKSSSSDEDEIIKENIQPVEITKPVPTTTNKIIEDLFTKPKSIKKEPEAAKVTTTSTHKVTPKPKIDLFSDNIFDDVDDIFTSEIVTKPKEANQKSIFDDDELFADVPKTTVKESKKSIFDSDDELFKDDADVPASNNNKESVLKDTQEVSKKKKADISIFSDDNDSDDIFVSNNNATKVYQSQATSKNTTQITENKYDTDISKSSHKINKNESNTQHTQPASNTLKPTLQQNKFESPLLFDDDDIDDFTSTNNSNLTKEAKVETKKHENVFDESIIKTTEDSKTNNNKTHEKQNTKESNLVINNNESDEYIFTLPKTTVVEDSKEESLKDVTSVSEVTKVTEIATKVETNIKINETEVKEIKDTPMNKEKDIDKREKTVKKPDADHSDSSLKPTISNDKTVNTDIVPPPIVESLPNITSDHKQHDDLDDLFSDVPPVFEKPSEPKKSKNVNALFDDDSDDEALFFRKSDVTEAEKPKTSYNDDRFRIFHDEPPDVEVDFVTKYESNVESDEDLFTLPKAPENKVTPKPNIEKPENVKSTRQIIEQDDLFTEIDTKENQQTEDESFNKKSKLVNSSTVESDNKFDTKIRDALEQNPVLPPNQDIKETETNKKSVGKLKPMNININVHSLLPGASPSKQAAQDESDGSAFSTQSNEELNKFSGEREESKMIKSVSFDGDPGSQVLDNKLSKGRAKIQVKRRPSSRRARLEAVRKSGIDFTDDSTDNSSSFDEPKPVSSDHGQTLERKEVPLHITKSDIVSSKTDNTVIESDGVSKKIPESNVNAVQSKTVYILHDEDIFTNSPNTKTDVKKSLTILDDDDDEDLFKSPSSKSVKDNKTSEKPKGDVKKDTNKTKTKSKDIMPKASRSIFDDLSDDEELFGGAKASESSSNKAKSIDNVKVSKLNVSAIKPGSLFGDDSDEDDLFKTTKKPELKPAKAKETAVKSEAVKDDPLSMFDDS